VRGGYGLPTELAPRLTVDAESASLALAHLGTQMGPGDLDLFAELRPPPGLRQTFPIKAASVLLAVIGGAGFALWHEATSIEGENAKLRQLTEQYAKKAKVNSKDLVQAARRARERVRRRRRASSPSRVFWADVLREVPSVVPASGTIVDFDGRDCVKFPPRARRRRRRASRRRGGVAAVHALDRGGRSTPPTPRRPRSPSSTARSRPRPTSTSSSRASPARTCGCCRRSRASRPASRSCASRRRPERWS
jgi:hypothetical protein